MPGTAALKPDQVPADSKPTPRHVHPEHRVHPKYDGDLRAEPDSKPNYRPDFLVNCESR
jgi:hypothetical protein